MASLDGYNVGAPGAPLLGLTMTRLEQLTVLQYAFVPDVLLRGLRATRVGAALLGPTFCWGLDALLRCLDRVRGAGFIIERTVYVECDLWKTPLKPAALELCKPALKPIALAALALEADRPLPPLPLKP